MKYTIIAAALLALAGTALAQQNTRSVTVSTGADYARDVFYSLANGEVKSHPRDDWDVALMINASSAVLANTGSGTAVFLAGAAADWATLDTTGKVAAETALYDDPTNWASGALNRAADPENWADLGWGDYDLQTHVITGSRAFFIRTRAGEWRKFLIEKRASGAYNLRWAALDGAGEQTASLNTNDYAAKNFAFLNLETGDFIDREPASADWDLLFTRYTDYIDSGPGGLVPYGVTGVKTNEGVRVDQLDNVDESRITDTSAVSSWSLNANEIGYDWKTFTGGVFEVAEQRVYIVKTREQRAFKLVFTGFGGSTNGDYMFDQTELTPTSRGLLSASSAFWNVAPNPASNVINLTLDTPVNETLNLRLLDMTGRVVLQRRLDATAGASMRRIELPEMPAGLYTLTVESTFGVATQRLLIQPRL